MTSQVKNLMIVAALGAVVGGIAVAQVQPWQGPKVSTQSNSFSAALDAETTGQPVSKTISSVSAGNMAALREMDASFASLAEYVSPSVVQVRSEGDRSTDLWGRRMGASGGVGTGIIYRADGWIITNDHVVGGFDKVTVILSDGKEYPGTVRRAKDSDIAVVKIDAKDLSPANFADSDAVRVGQFTMAVGSPFDLENTVTFGHVSAQKRTRLIGDARSGERFYPDLIQTDASINQGNSGGPLFNIDGQVIGINSAIASTTGGSNGIGFAITSNFARLLADTLIEKGKVNRAAMGLAPVDVKPYRLKELNLKGGAEVQNIPASSPSGKAGLKQGDVITKIGDTNVLDQMDLRAAMYRYEPGQSVDVTYVRDGQTKTVKVTLAKPADVDAIQQQQQQQLNTPDMPKRENGSTPFEDLPDNLRDFFKQQEREEGKGGTDDSVKPLRSGPAKLGVGIGELNAETRKQHGITGGPNQGAIVTEVEPGSVADKLGLKPGMVIETLNGRTISKPEDVRSAMAGVKWGDKTRIKFGQYKDGMSMSQERDVDFR